MGPDFACMGHGIDPDYHVIEPCMINGTHPDSHTSFLQYVSDPSGTLERYPEVHVKTP